MEIKGTKKTIYLLDELLEIKNAVRNIILELGKKKNKVKHFKKKKGKKRRNGIELKIAVIHEGKEARYRNDYKLKNKIIVGTASKARDLKRIQDAIIGTTYKEYKIKNIEKT